jgi:hypothetical protein
MTSIDHGRYYPLYPTKLERTCDGVKQTAKEELTIADQRTLQLQEEHQKLTNEFAILTPWTFSSTRNACDNAESSQFKPDLTEEVTIEEYCKT